MALTQISQDYSDVTLSRIETIKNCKNIRAIHYKDEYSVDHCSYKDLELGHIHGKVGCNSKIFNATHPGDIVMIKGTKNKKDYISIGIIRTRIAECTLWQDHGGHKWTYNFTYTPITDIIEITPTFKATVIELGRTNNCNSKNFFNARFCSVKLKSIFLDLVVDNII